MIRHAINGVLLLMVVGTVGANVYFRQVQTQPNVEYFPDMARTAAYGTYEPNPNFADGKTLQPPVANTIARGFPPLGYGPGAADNVRAGDELRNPYSLSDKVAVARGELVFDRYCVPCHGPKAVGDGLVVEHGFRRPPNLTRPFTKLMKDGQIFHLATFGRGAMPAHGSQIPLADRWKVVLWVRTLQGFTANNPPPTAAPPTAPSAAPPAAGAARPARGE